MIDPREAMLARLESWADRSVPSPEQHKAALDAAVESLDPTIWGELSPDAPRQIIESAIAIYHAHLLAFPEQTEERWWRPIADAPPKDGTIVDLYHRESGRWPNCYWGLPPHSCGESGQYCDNDDWHGQEPRWVDGTFGEFIGTDGFTHWRPLPAPTAGEFTMKGFVRPRWMNTRFGGSDGNPEKRDADLVAMVDALAERVAKLEAKNAASETCDPNCPYFPPPPGLLCCQESTIQSHHATEPSASSFCASEQDDANPIPWDVPPGRASHVQAKSDLARVTKERDQLLADLECVGCPPGYRVLNDGPGREVLVHDDDEECPVFETKVRAVLFAWANYEPDQA